jgi:hypothetical protein
MFRERQVYAPEIPAGLTDPVLLPLSLPPPLTAGPKQRAPCHAAWPAKAEIAPGLLSPRTQNPGPSIQGDQRQRLAIGWNGTTAFTVG